MPLYRYGHLPTPATEDALVRPCIHLVGPASAAAPAPYEVSLASYVFQVLDQKTTNSCVIHAISGAIMILWAKEGRVDLRVPCRRAAYFEARRYDGLHVEDGGCFVPSAYRAFEEFGFCPESVYPFEVNGQVGDVLEIPPLEVYRAAFDQERKIERYRCTGSIDVRRALASGYPVTVALTVDEDFENLAPGAIWMPGGKVLGSHYVTITGYDQDSFEVLNSWGTVWARGGFGRIAAALLDNPRVAAEMFAVTVAPRFSGPVDQAA